MTGIRLCRADVRHPADQPREAVVIDGIVVVDPKVDPVALHVGGEFPQRPAEGHEESRPRSLDRARFHQRKCCAFSIAIAVAIAAAGAVRAVQTWMSFEEGIDAMRKAGEVG